MYQQLSAMLSKGHSSAMQQITNNDNVHILYTYHFDFVTTTAQQSQLSLA